VSCGTEAKGNQYSCNLIITLGRPTYLELVQPARQDVANPSKGLGQKNGLKGPRVAAILPEAGRSIPGQVEVARKGDGGLN
jgi:hypothetical protein